MHIFRKHKKWLLVIIGSLTAFSMLFFGIPLLTDSTPENVGDIVLAEVGDVPITAAEYQRNLDIAAQRARRGPEQPSYKELAETGVADRVMEEMISSALIRLEERKRGMEFEDSFLETQLRKDPTFLNEETGEFDAKKWNTWIQRAKNVDWNAVYEDVAETAARNVYMSVVLAPGRRVLDSELDRMLEENHTKIKIRYAKLESEIALSDEELKAHYDEHLDRYKAPDKMSAEFVRIPLLPEPNETVRRVLEDARAGMEFDAISEKYGPTVAQDSGEMDWLSASTRGMTPEAVFELAPGAVSEPLPVPGGFQISKVLEERTNEDSGERELRLRQLTVRQTLPPEEREKRLAQAEAIAAAAEAAGSLEAAAKDAALEVFQTATFDTESASIENVAESDTRLFSSVVSGPPGDEGKQYQTVPARENVYVVHVLETTPGTVKPFEEVKEQVRQNLTAERQASEEYRETLKTLAEQIKAEAKSLDEAGAKFPEALGEIQETKEPFTAKDQLFQQQLYLQTPEIFYMLRDKSVGELAGPLTSFLGETYLVELSEKTGPTEEDREGWAEERKQLRDQLAMQHENGLLQDYLAHLRTRVLPQVSFEADEEMRHQLLGLNQDSMETTSTDAVEAPGNDPDAAGTESAAPGAE